MKKIIVITGILLLAFSGVKAQQLINGEKAPELKLSEWISKNQLQSGKPTLIEFFFSRSDPEYEAPAHRGRLRAELRQKTERSRHRLRNER